VVYPIDVFTTLASRTDIKTLLFSMPHLLSSYHVYVVVGRAANEPVAVENRDQLERISLGCTSEDYKANFSVIVYPGTSKEGREVKCFCDIFNSLLSEVKRKFRALAKDEQLRIVDFLINSANRAFGNDPFQGKEALTLSVTALVAHNLLTDLTINDYIVRLKLLILCGRMNERQEVADISRAAFFYGAARELIEGIPHEIRENDKIALIIEEILIRCLVSEQTDKQLKTCLLASNSFRQQGKTDEAQRMLALTFNRLNIRQCINLSNPGPKERLVVCAMRFFSKDQRQEFLSFLQASPSK
ncbi:MAG: hypothetical protein LRY43_04295, partial [Gammaproteobacteria bacterium]|nr:hypothetical protein [Gammaproteobacteria bacterium]